MRALSIALLLSAALVQPAFAEEAGDWLVRLAKADQQQRFHGTFIYERNGSFSTHRVWRQLDADGKMNERLLQLDGAEQEILKVDGRVRCVAGGMADQVEGAAFWPSRSLDTARLQSFYELKIGGRSRIAGRPAVVVLMAPRDQHRYGFELHLDQETALPLKSLLLNEKGLLLERFQFAEFDPSAEFDSAALVPGKACQPVRAREEPTSVDAGWHAQWLPPGFELSGVVERKGTDDAPVIFMTYADGLARFSIFVESLNGSLVEDARHQLGPTVVVSRRVTAPEGDYMITVVGEIPFGTAERVAVSLSADVGVSVGP